MRSSDSVCEPGMKRTQPFCGVESLTASQQVAVDGSVPKSGQYAMSWCHAKTESALPGRLASS